jgi:predicted metal-dependent phosphoesterase TrpH
MFLADLHVHSNFSDGSLSIAQLVDFYGKRGFGCIAITDHICERRTVLGYAARYMKITLTEDTFPQYLAEIDEQGQRALEQYGMLVLPGYELTKNTFSNHRSAHILGLDTREFVEANGDIVELARKIRTGGGLAVAAHPVKTYKPELQTLHLWDRRWELANEFDAWEVASGDQFFTKVAESGVPMLATSDFHHERNIRGWKTAFSCERHPEAIKDAIRKQQQMEFRFYQEPLATVAGAAAAGAGVGN